MKALTQALALALILATTLSARAADRVYVVVSYMHIPEGKNPDDYIALEKLWQRLHQKAVDSGFCRGWELNRVENGGRNQFVTVEFYDSLDKVADRWPASLRANLYNDAEMEKIGRTDESRDLTHSEIWEIEASVVSSTPEVVKVDFMKAKGENQSEYYALERNVYKKLLKAHIDAGEMKAWWFLSRLIPNGTDSEFDYVTVNAFPENRDKWTPDSKLAETALSAEERSKVAAIFGMRTMVRSEVWHMVLHTERAKK